MWSSVRNYVVVKGKMKRTEGFETGRLLHEDLEGFERARAMGLKNAWRGFYFFLISVVIITIVLFFIKAIEFFVIIPILWPIFIFQEWMSIRAWRSLDHGKRIYERGVETYLIQGWFTARHFVPFNEIKEWKRSDQFVHIKASRWALAWFIDVDEVGEEGLDLLCSILDGTYKAEAEPPKLVLYPS